MSPALPLMRVWMQAQEKHTSDSMLSSAVALWNSRSAVRSSEQPAIGACNLHRMAKASVYTLMT
eukprot:3591093-Amphidinium_carterae.1